MAIKDCCVYDNCNHKYCNSDFCLRNIKLTKLYDAALMPQALRKHITLLIDDDGTDFAKFKQLGDIELNIEEFVNSGKNLYLHSSYCGNGKTSWAVRLIQDYFNKIWPKSDLTCRALFISVPRFLNALKENISKKNEYFTYINENILNADLVVWDDIAAKMGTEFEINQLLSLIDARISEGKSNIYTSNMNATEIANSLGARLASRICRYSTDIEFNGADKRIIAAGGIN